MAVVIVVEVSMVVVVEMLGGWSNTMNESCMRVADGKRKRGARKALDKFLSAQLQPLYKSFVEMIELTKKVDISNAERYLILPLREVTSDATSCLSWFPCGDGLPDGASFSALDVDMSKWTLKLQR